MITLFRRIMIFSVLGLFCVSAFAAGGGKKCDIEWLFVIHANTSQLVPQKAGAGVLQLTLKSDKVFYFSDRPNRVVGHMSIANFLTTWQKGKNSFAKDSPNAAVAALTAEGSPSYGDSYIILSKPRYDAKKKMLSFSIRSLSKDKLAPISATHTTLFIDTNVNWGNY